MVQCAWNEKRAENRARFGSLERGEHIVNCNNSNCERMTPANHFDSYN